MQTDEKTEKDTGTPRLSTAHSRELGEELRRTRHRAAMSSGSVAEAMGWSLGKLSKLETGTRGTSAWEIGTLIGRLGADKPTRDRILIIASEPDTGSFLRPHNGIPDTLAALTLHEQAARSIIAYEPLAIPALAQTEDYAYALTGDRDLAKARVFRREIQRRRAAGADTVLYTHEAALRMMTGGPEVMRDQLLHLTLMCGWPHITPRVIPMTAQPHAALQSSAALLTFAPPTKPLAYTETDAATVFHDHPSAVARYQAKMRHLAALALSAAKSHDVIARWADSYDRKSR
ncbi:hypothetical protein F4560_008609 [Saccharothrix ecbatanensis]|uniref:DUF5753 domain-containing protein n=1 Tax=Saccharothrix ecbatanensis TaxID=1105145 RepID=A0A7W9M642_9PSEU|nr:helix-turn-helix transcriptional regulator [Saccharothrix ecbatanensis]MBB5808841.1 hypothetical protein [Saccharothrix ecbatanensis]